MVVVGGSGKNNFNSNGNEDSSQENSYERSPLDFVGMATLGSDPKVARIELKCLVV